MITYRQLFKYKFRGHFINIINIQLAKAEQTFKDDTESEKEETIPEVYPIYEFGRCWEITDLHSLNTPTLHNLW